MSTTLTFAFRRGSAGGAVACAATTAAFAVDANGAFSVAVPLEACANQRGLFDGEAVFYDVYLGGSATGTPVVSAVRVTPVPYARFADQAGVNNDCPTGYVRDTSETAIRLCVRRRGDGAVYDEVVRVGEGASAFWVDRYEAGAWATRDGTGAQYGAGPSANDYPATFPRNGQWTQRVYALARAGVAPSVNLTWFQANEACRASGKRLLTGSEWLTAARGTADVVSNGTGGVCNTQSGGARTTGGGALCRGEWGAQDMIGNVWEWTDEWYAGLGNGTTSTPNGISPTDGWPVEGDLYRGDGSYNIASSAYSEGGGARVGIPAAAYRGGTWNGGPLAGVFALALSHAPSHWSPNFGFRCVVPR